MTKRHPMVAYVDAVRLTPPLALASDWRRGR